MLNVIVNCKCLLETRLQFEGLLKLIYNKKILIIVLANNLMSNLSKLKTILIGLFSRELVFEVNSKKDARHN
jgi:hypothetical protein